MRISSVQVKRHQLLVIFETKKSAFLQILHHSSVSWERTPLYFLAATLYIFNKRSLSKYTFGETWYEQSKVWNLHFDGFLLSKSFKVSAEKVKKSYFSWHWRVMQSLKKNLFVASNMAQGIWWIFFDGLFLSKICKVWATKIQRSYLSRHWTVMKNLNKCFWFQKWHEELDELSLEHSKIWKIEVWWTFFVQSI